MSFNDGPMWGRGGRRPGPPGATPEKQSLRDRLVTLGHIGRLTRQVWRTSPPLTVATIVLRLIRAVQPVVALYVGKLIIDEVVRQLGQPLPGPELSDWVASGRLTGLGQYLALELALVVGNDLLTRATSLVDSILG